MDDPHYASISILSIAIFGHFIHSVVFCLRGSYFGKKTGLLFIAFHIFCSVLALFFYFADWLEIPLFSSNE